MSTEALRPAPTKADVVATLQRHRSELHLLGVKTIALFGSFARDAQTDASDLDVMVEFSEPTYDNFLRLDEFLEQLFGRRVDILTPAGIDSIRVPGIAAGIKQSLVHV